MELDFSVPDAPAVAAPAPMLSANAPLDLLDLENGAPPATAAPPTPARAAHKPAAPPPAKATADLGFSLELDSDDAVAPDAKSPKRPQPHIVTPPPVAMSQAGDPDGSLGRPDLPDLPDLPSLAPPRKLGESRGHKAAQLRVGLLLKLAGAAAGMAAIIVLMFSVVLPFLRSGPSVAKVLDPYVADLARDHYPVYQRAAEQLTAAASERTGAAELRAAAAELWLLSVLARGGEKARIGRAEQALGAIDPTTPPTPQISRARALLAVAKGKGREAETLLGPDAQTPDGQLVLALRHLSEGKAAAAAETLRRFVAGRGDRLVGQYLLGRALEDQQQAPGASDAYNKVVARTNTHAGARLGLGRLGAEGPAQRIDLAQGIIERGPAATSPGELAEAYVMLGRAAQALGRRADATAAFGKALGADPQNVSANLALGEALLFDHHQTDALARFRLTGPAGLRTADGKFGLGGALIANRQAGEGTPLVLQAAQERPNDPRGPFWQGWLAEEKTPPDWAAAAYNYREALAKDRKFLPAALRLASLLQRQGQGDESLNVLRAAEDAGVPPTLLQIAWGDALIGAGQPDRAEDVFRKALATDAKLGPARLGLAAALEGQGKTGAAKEELQKALTEMPELAGLRERIALLALKVGQKDEALAMYRAEVATGKAELRLRVDMAKLALDMGQVELALGEIRKVIAEDASTPDALFTLGRLYDAQGDTARAIQEYRRAMVYGVSPELHLAMGRALDKVGKEDEAMTELDAAGELAPAKMARGKMFLRRSDLSRALADFQAGGRLAPTDPEAFLRQGLCHDQMGQQDQAAAAWQTAVKLAPELPEPHFRLGRLELDHNHPKEALAHLRAATVNLPPKTDWAAQAFFHLGYAEKAAGSRQLAVAALRKYLDLAAAEAPDRSEVEREIDRLSRR